MTDQTRDQLIEQAARTICAAYEAYPRLLARIRSQAPDIARALADASLLADPEQRTELERLQRRSAAHEKQWLETQAELDKMADFAGTQSNARRDADRERDALQARIADVVTKIKGYDGYGAGMMFHDELLAALQGDQPAGPEVRCMNGPAKQHTLHMVGVIKALKSAAELDHLPLEPLRRDNFVRLARAIADHWPRDIDKPAAPFDLLETEEL